MLPDITEVAMKFPKRVGFIVAMGFVLVGLTSCRGVRLGGLADEAGRAIRSGVDNGPQPIRNVGDDIPTAPVDLNAQAPEVVKVEPVSEKVVKAVIEEAGNQLIDVSIDCATGDIQPSGAIDPSQQSNVVEAACQQILGSGGAVTSEVRVVQAGEGYSNLRSIPSTETATVARVSNGTSVQIIEQRQNSAGQLWYKVNVNGQEGWIFSGLLD
jgi:hypothetical protein